MSRFLRSLLAATALALGLAATVQAQPGAGRTVVSSERVRAELLAHAPDGVAPGKTLWLGLQLAHAPEWHTYWKNSGDSGLPTQLQWTLPAGLQAGEVDWPLPRKIPIGNLANYGYEGTVLLPVPVTVGPDFRPPPFGDVTVQLQASWLVCRKECIPEDGSFTLKLPVGGSTAANGAAFEAAWKARPAAIPATGSTLRIAADGKALELRVQGLPAAARGRELQFFPETPEVIETAGAWTQAWDGAAWTARVPLSAQRSASPAVMPVVLAAGTQGWRAELPVAGSWPASQAPAAVSPALAEALRQNAAAPAPAPAPAGPGLGFWAALAGALLGGLVLNLMPCVFPVLAIKLVGFARHADDVRGHRVAGLAYTAGVVLSFVALGALMLALRGAGEQLGWGFQLQSPAVVATLAALFTLIGLNLAGVFEVGNLLPSSLATLQVRHPAGDAFVSGVLAVAVASPCTAPFMGASLGLAITLPALQAVAVFAALGLGMALPYLLAAWVPAIARRMPRPGPWMDTFRRLLAFPMFATVAWLAWVLGQQAGIDGVGALLALLVALALLAWTVSLRGRARLGLGALALASLGALAAWLGPLLLAAPPAAVQAQAGAPAEGGWQPWSPGRVEQLLAQGRPVFVDYTAAWCVTCQYNKKTTLADARVLDDFQARNVALLRADWTRRDPQITAALQALGRSGVPVYVVHAPGRPPVVLSEILGVQEVRDALSRL